MPGGLPRGRPLLVAAGALVAIAAAIVLPLLLTGGDSGPRRALPQASGRSSEPTTRSSFLARIIPPPPEQVSGPPVARSVADLAKRLPLERKVAQLFVLGYSGRGTHPQILKLLAQRDIGAIAMTAANYSDPTQLVGFTRAVAAVARRHGRVPPWVMARQDGGGWNAFGDLPPFDAPADMPSAEAAGKAAALAANTLRRLGVTGVLGPSLDVGPSAGGVLGSDVFAGNPADVSDYARAVVPRYDENGVLAAVSHFPGLGSATQAPEQGPAQVGSTLDALSARDLAPFRAAFAAGAQAVLVGPGLYVTDDFTTPASLSRVVMQRLLRATLKFRGVAIADDLEQPAISEGTAVPDAAIQAIDAGADMVYISGPAGDQDAAYTAVLDAVRRHEIPQSRIDQAVLRVLQAKRALGLISGR